MGAGMRPFRLMNPAAAFFVTGALIGRKELLVENCGLNPSRLGFLHVLKRMGARLEIEEADDIPFEEFLGKYYAL